MRCGREIDPIDTDAARILELSQKAYSLYVNRNPDDQRELLDLLLSNSTLTGGKVESALRYPFDVIADGIAEEEAVIQNGRPFSDARKIWLRRSDSNLTPVHPGGRRQIK